MSLKNLFLNTLDVVLDKAKIPENVKECVGRELLKVPKTCLDSQSDTSLDEEYERQILRASLRYRHIMDDVLKNLNEQK